MIQIDERKYSLQSRLDIMPRELQTLFREFHAQLGSEICALRPISKNDPWSRTHIRGLTYFWLPEPREGFLVVDFRQSFILLHVHAYSDKFQELEPIINYPNQWYYRIKSREHLAHAVLYAKESYKFKTSQ